MNSKITETGIAVVYKEDSKHKYYWSQELGSEKKLANPGDSNISLDIDSIPPISEGIKSGFLKAVNDVRAKGVECGEYGYFKPAPALKWSDELFKAAYMHSWDMAKWSQVAHLGTGSESDAAAQAYHPGKGSSTAERAKFADYDYVKLSENIVAGSDKESVEDMVSSILEDATTV